MTDQNCLDQKTLIDLIDKLQPPEIMKTILRLVNKNRLIALWACKYGFAEIRVLPPPTRPQSVQSYYNLRESERKDMNAKPEKYQNFWEAQEVKAYFDSYNLIKLTNRHNKEWLGKIKSWLDPAEDSKQISMVESRLCDFVDKTEFSE